MAAAGGSVIQGVSRLTIPPKIPPTQTLDKYNSEIETKVDEEQQVKLEETVELLLAAGYFRARIKGLSPFDKIVGGMTWCIEMCSVDVNVDLLFHENLTIGQKITLTEKIVAVLPRMKCPHRIEPHQIQGLDFIHIYPVVQWLVKRAIENREEMGDYIRAYSISQFYKSHNFPADGEFEGRKTKMITSLMDLKESYRPSRKYRHQAPHKIKDEETRVQTTLLEYGRRHGLSQAGALKQGDTVEKKTKLTDEESQEEEERIQSLLSGMRVMEEQESKLTPSAVGSIVSLQSSEIQQVASEYADRQAQLAAQDRTKEVGGMQHHMRVVASLNKQLSAKNQQIQEVQNNHEELKKTHEENLEKLHKLQATRAQLLKQVGEIEALENDNNKSVIKKLQALVMMNENLKHQEQEFRSQCKEELVRLQTQVDSLKSSTQDGSTEDLERAQLIERQYSVDKEKFQKIRMLLAKKNREIASLQRKIDEVPSRAELNQYQRRFIELYNQVSARHRETKQFYTLYNTLDDTRMYLNKEVNLLNSILDNFTEAMSSSATKGQFLTQFEQIVEGIRQNRLKVEKKKQVDKMKRDQLNDQYLDLVEKQRLYFKTVRDFKEECRKNEILVAKLKERSQ
ncbi:coiled-coil domain-containing protein 93-like isoform X2 [Tachypleus tridentatus]|uniref:coiled-coil domain-containing protein 93-like isoform X2 n=1 Tax=Tachypleus tridentatus TaxID=6853 RepID=UPI003FD22675